MTQEELRTLLRGAVGVVEPAARDRLGAFMRGDTDVLELRYDWELDWPALCVVLNSGQVEFSDGSEWIKIWRLKDD